MYPVAVVEPTQFSGHARVMGEWFPDASRGCPDGTGVAWFLMGRLTAHGGVRIIAIRVSPFRIGRDRGMDLAVPFPTVSRIHAEILVDGGSLVIRDLSSRNGTFVNGQRIQASVIIESDSLVQFANIPFRIFPMPETRANRT